MWDSMLILDAICVIYFSGKSLRAVDIVPLSWTYLANEDKMKQYADILAFGRDGQLALIAEVKNKRGTSSDWAAKMRRNMFAHGLMPNAPFFLLALPDVFYLWNNKSSALELVEPTQTVDPRLFLQPYYETSGISSDNLTEISFGFIVTSWLNQVLGSRNPQNLLSGNQDWLVSSGLFDKLAGGHLELEAAA